MNAARVMRADAAPSIDTEGERRDAAESGHRIDLVLIRHPAVAIEPGICYGRTDISLEQPAARAAEHFASWVAGRHPDASPLRLYASPLVRCASVAAHLASTWHVPAQMDADLVEIDFGEWELRRWDAIARDALDAWAADIEHGRPHGGESAAMVGARARRWLARACSDGPATIVAVTHAGVIRMLAAHVFGEPVAQSLQRALAYGSVCRFAGRANASSLGSHGVGWTLTDWNVVPG